MRQGNHPDRKIIQRTRNEKKVLIVDDDPGIVEMVEFELKVYGYDVSTASSGKEV